MSKRDEKLVQEWIELFRKNTQIMLDILIKKDGGEVKVSCLELEKKACKDRTCDATLSKNPDGTFTLVTGIIPNPDYLGETHFKIEDVCSIGIIDQYLIIKVFDEDGNIKHHQKIEPRK